MRTGCRCPAGTPRGPESAAEPGCSAAVPTEPGTQTSCWSSPRTWMGGRTEEPRLTITAAHREDVAFSTTMQSCTSPSCCPDCLPSCSSAPLLRRRGWMLDGLVKPLQCQILDKQACQTIGAIKLHSHKITRCLEGRHGCAAVLQLGRGVGA